MIPQLFSDDHQKAPGKKDSSGQPTDRPGPGRNLLNQDEQEKGQACTLIVDLRLRLQPGQEQALKALRRGWCVGSEQFKQQKIEEFDGRVGGHHFGQMRLEVAQAKAERIILEELGRRGWQEPDLVARSTPKVNRGIRGIRGRRKEGS